MYGWRPLINLCQRVPQLRYHVGLLNKPSLEVAHELVCRFIFGADEAEWALTGHPLINIPKIRQLSKMIELCTK